VEVSARRSQRSMQPVDQQLRSCLSRCETKNAETIARETGMPPDAVAARLRELVDRREIEVLHPLLRGHEAVGKTNHGDSAVFFRLIRPTDDDHLWEQELVVRLPACSAHKQRELEARQSRASAARRAWSWRPVFRTARYA